MKAAAATIADVCKRVAGAIALGAGVLAFGISGAGVAARAQSNWRAFPWNAHGAGMVELHRSNDGPTEFLMRARELVKLEGSRLARCDAAECRRLFVRRKRGLFCDKKCAQRERVRLWRERQRPVAQSPAARKT
jgi:hypothetical protein